MSENETEAATEAAIEEVSLVPVTEAISRLNKIIYSNVHEAGGAVSPIEIMQRSRIMAVEIKVLREFMFDVLSADEDGEVNFAFRQHIAKGFFERLAEQLNEEAEREETRQRIAIPAGKINGRSRG